MTSTAASIFRRRRLAAFDSFRSVAMILHEPSTIDESWVQIREEYPTTEERERPALPAPILSPSNDALPMEILTTIFELLITTFKESRATQRSTDGSASCIPILHVCRFWRDAALGCPGLWTNISVLPFRGFEVTHDEMMRRDEFMAWYLSHSKTMPLHLKHDLVAPLRYVPNTSSFRRPLRLNPWIQQGAWDRAIHHADRMLDALVLAQNRWETLEITFDHNLLQKFNKLCWKDPESPILGITLRQLRIKLDCDRVNRYLDGLFLWISMLPKLDLLRVDDPLWSIVDLTTLPLAGITNIELGRPFITLSECVQFLSICTSAVTVVIDGDASEENSMLSVLDPLVQHAPLPIKNQPLALRNLTKLTLCSIDSMALFSHLSLPCLTDLVIIDGDSPISDETITTFTNFLNRSQYPLERLVMNDYGITEKEILRFLSIEGLSNIREVDIGPIALSEVTCPELAEFVVVAADQNMNEQLLPRKFTVWTKQEDGAEGCHFGWKTLLQDDEQWLYSHGDSPVDVDA